MKPATEILLSAAFVLTPEENWVQGLYEHGDAMCMATAISKSMDAAGVLDFPTREDIRRYVYGAIGGGSMVGFNDSPDRTHAEVLDALYRAAELSEAA